MSASSHILRYVDSLALLFQAIASANPKLLQALSATDLLPGVPTPMTSPVAGGVNTSIVLTPIAGQGFFGPSTVYYPRVDIGASFSALSIAPTLNLPTTVLTSWNDVIDALNARYNLRLAYRDAPVTPFEIGPPAPSTLTFAINPTSYLYIGTLEIALQGIEAVPMATFANTLLNGLTPSQPMSRFANTVLDGLIPSQPMSSFTHAVLDGLTAPVA